MADRTQRALGIARRTAHQHAFDRAFAEGGVADEVAPPADPYDPLAASAGVAPPDTPSLAQKAVDWWKAQPSWLEQAAAVRAQSDPSTLRPSEQELEFASNLAGGFMGRIGKAAPKANPALAERYPQVGEPILKTKPEGVPIAGKTEQQAQDLVDQGKAFWSKGPSAEAAAAQKARTLVQRDIEAGNYTPYFDVAQRADIDPSGYPPYASTENVVPAKQQTIDKYAAMARHPEASARLEEAYLRGKQIPNSNNWYFMKQLEGEFIKEYGPEQGRVLFKNRFADPMAATTGGADPTGNLMMAHYGNWMRQQGQPVPTAGYKLPFPVGGRYVSGNMAQYNKMLTEGAGVTPENPKRYNFSANFYGNPQGATLDEQMMSLFDPKMGLPPPGTYGVYQAALRDLAIKHGVDPREFQEVAWSGHKAMTDPSYLTAKPMIQHVNEAIERTSRMTGVSPAEVVRRAIVRNEMPLYGAAGVPLFGAGADEDRQWSGKVTASQMARRHAHQQAFDQAFPR